MQKYWHWNPLQETQFSHRNMWGFIQSRCCKEAGWAGRAQKRAGRAQRRCWPLKRDLFTGGSHLQVPWGIWAWMRPSCWLLPCSAYFRINWSQCALTWQSDPSCYGTPFRSAAIPWCALHGLAIFDTGSISCSLLSRNGRASFLCPWHCPKHGTCEFRLARP